MLACLVGVYTRGGFETARKAVRQPQWKAGLRICSTQSEGVRNPGGSCGAEQEGIGKAVIANLRE